VLLLANEIDKWRRGGLTGWVESVNVNGDVHRVLGADPVTYLLYNAIHTWPIPRSVNNVVTQGELCASMLTNRVDFSCFHNLKPAVSIVIIIRRA
jgi:hypothetical protein